MRPFATRRHVALAAAIFALTLAGFFLARAAAARDARSESRRDADLATLQISDSVERATGYVDGLRQVFGGRAAVTQEAFSEFADAALRPAGLQRAAWVERVRGAADRRYEARLTVAEPDAGNRFDWGRAPALRRLLDSSSPLFGVASTSLVLGPGRARGLYFAESAPPAAATRGERPGFVVVFVPASWLLSSPRGAGIDQRVVMKIANATIGATGATGNVVRRSFGAAGRHWTVGVPARAPRGASALLPWLILLTGAIVAVLAGLLGVNVARRERLAAEHAALRRVATLVAQGASPMAVFDSVAAEVEALLEADGVLLGRYEPGDEVTFVAHRGATASRLPPGIRVSHEGSNVTTMVRRSARPARVRHSTGAEGALARLVRDMSVHDSVGAPIVVEGRVWGIAIANWQGGESPPAGTEERLAEFARLLETAIANADSRQQLTASRARLLTEADEARRRLARDLHDGAQRRLINAIVTLKLARRSARQNDGQAESLMGVALEYAERGNRELRELAHGILPSALTAGGLAAGIQTLAEPLDLPVDVDVVNERFAPDVEANAYFIVAEALTNVVKHACAQRAEVRACSDDGLLRVEVRDDGIGGADVCGHGLIGLRDRATALGGRLEIDSPARGGTLVTATLPLSGRAALAADPEAAL